MLDLIATKAIARSFVNVAVLLRKRKARKISVFYKILQFFKILKVTRAKKNHIILKQFKITIKKYITKL